MSLQNKKAIVTGASKGIGLAISKALLNEGVNVAGWSRSKPDYSHANFHHVAVDLANEEEVEKAFWVSQDMLGKDIHFLINNAGLGYRGAIEEMPIEKWKQLFDINVHGLFYVTKRIVPEMKRMQEGHIINIASGAGTNGIPNMVAYCGTKHAVVGISHSMHAELRNDGIKVTCLSPGSVYSDFEKNMGVEKSDKNKMMPEDIASAVIHALNTSQNFHYVDMEVRPLQPNKKS